MNTVQKILWGLIFLSAVCSIIVSGERISIEQKNRKVQLVVDYSSLVELSMQEGKSVEETVTLFKNAGITGMAFNEDTLETLKTQGLINWYAGHDLARALNSGLEKLPEGVSKETLPSIKSGTVYIAVYDSKVLDQLLTFLPLFCGSGNVERWPSTGDNQQPSIDNPAILSVAGDEKFLSTMGCGFSRELTSRYSSQGLSVILRPENKRKADSVMIRAYTDVLKGFSPTALIFTGSDNDVLGFPEYLPETAELINNLGCQVGVIEAPNVKAMQKGIQTISSKCIPLVLRVQSVAPLFQEKLKISDLIDKFELGVRERNIRLLYLRPYTKPVRDKSLLETNLHYISELRKAIVDKGFEPGPAVSFPHYSPSFVLLFILALGTGAASLLLLIHVFQIQARTVFILALLWIIMLAVLAFSRHFGMAQKLAALAGSLVFPTLSILIFLPSMKESLKTKSFLNLLGSSTLIILKVTLLTLMGGLIVQALLAATPFLLQIDRFRGIKLLMIIPPLFVAIYYVLKGSSNRSSIRQLLGFPIEAWHLLALCVLGGAGAYYILRTGNASEAATSDIELSVRALLNQIMLVRPRFKEFLMAYPALMAAVAFLKLNIEKGVWLLLLMAAIGQADIIDTLAHLHTPLLISLVRIAYGFVLGWIIGAAVLLIIWQFRPKQGN
ncbi:MAG: DUF5693 family protein [Candidatus Xenobiia bacterium LiM19]